MLRPLQSYGSDTGKDKEDKKCNVDKRQGNGQEKERIREKS